MRVLISRPRENADSLAEALITIGAEPVFFPTIKIAPVEDPSLLDGALTTLSHYDWLVFTSINAVQVVLERLEFLEASLPPGLRVAAVGPKTASSLETNGIIPHFVPAQFISEAILPGLGELKGKRVLLPSSNIAAGTLANEIESAGGEAHVVTAYRTLSAEPDPAGLAALRHVDVITFTSGSTVRNFVNLVNDAGLDPFHLPGAPRIVCNGPKTAAVAKGLGFQVDMIAEEFTVEGLIKAIQQFPNIHYERTVPDPNQ